MLSNNPRFRIKKWLNTDEFKQLMLFSKYLGRFNGTSLYELDPERMKKNGLTVEDVIAILSSFDVPEEDIDLIKKSLFESKKVIIYLGEDGWLRIRSRVYLKNILSELGVYFPYDRMRREYKAPAFHYRQIIEHLKNHGLYVEDKLGLLDNAELPRKIRFLGKLRPYQEEALAAWKKAGYRGIIALPTGAGKTVIADAGIAELSRRTLVVVYTREHVMQWIESIRKFTDAGALVGAYYGDEKRLAPITITTYQTAFRKASFFAPLFSLIVFDEVHHLPADKFRKIAVSIPAPFRLGLSATVEREDGRHKDLFPLLGGIVYKTTPGQLTRQGYLAPYVIKRIKIELTPDEKKEYDRLKRIFITLTRGAAFRDVLERARKGDKDAIQALRVHAEMKKIVQYSESKLREVEKIVKNELKKGSKIIVFTQYKKQAEEIARRVNGLLLHGGLDRRKREEILKKFKNMKTGVLVVTTVGDEGLDIPDADVGILVSGTSSPRQFLQRLGRLLRPKDGKQARLYEIIVAGTSEEYQSRKRRKISGF